jgi:hypothetical protein
MKAKVENAQRLSETLHIYGECSGQCVNRDKRSIYFCPNTHGPIHKYLKQHMAITVEASTILGSPYSSGTHYQWYV